MGYTMAMHAADAWSTTEPEWDSARLIESIMAGQANAAPVNRPHDETQQGPGSRQFRLLLEEMALASALEGLFDHGDGSDEEAPGHDC